MTKNHPKDFKKIADYSIALMEEISRDIQRLTEYVGAPVGNNLDDINNKIDLARSYGVNVDILDKQVLDFRVVLFKRRIDTKIEEVHNTKSKLSFEIDTIKSEFKELKLEASIDLGDLQLMMHNLYNEVARSKIKFMINDVKLSNESSVYTIEQIAIEIEKVKEDGLNVNDIEEMLFE